ncbi:hypothetical protein TVAG_051170 [Trichomonas vaginalis G3]|uniref:Uncharacterized protein n=1 Tax=Trichomonas vaginalis (strain ATCC PRA-98 / G3) TaxID=412133 RepID=A2EES6_TRIV3|nr:hypothetical protein TVAGG3_0982120 [Trichomonas vaginalis G3]EAY08882.1 hypothetical protein TVAG_051170 [Trichomonas vaginalis G3]KAI5489377.1 hypothetical protein TVAGG3_0982120 [Trichomonas vaginalis G3]|eukprot:XP_001321105.1 hypothetical protein [Trichomonas vaginalis G3]
MKNQEYSYKRTPEHNWIKRFLGDKFTHSEIRAICSCLASLYELDFQREYYRTMKGCFFWIHENASIFTTQRKKIRIVFNDGTNTIIPPFTD